MSRKGSGTVGNGLHGNDSPSRESFGPESHIPVLLDKVIELMKPSPGKTLIDATGGPGNMSRALLDKSSPDGRVLTLDLDPNAIKAQESLLGEFGSRSVRRKTNFSEISSIAQSENFVPCDGILYDLGVSSPMLDVAGYGMAIRHADAELDMRFDPDNPVTARDVVNNYTVEDLTRILRDMDEYRFARRIANAIDRARRESQINTTGELAEIVEKAVPRRFHPRRMHVATRTFLAIRVEVNRERESLRKSLTDAAEVLSVGGVLIVICYSSFEDRIVKEVTREAKDRWEKISKKAIRADEEEIERNPRSRSARLRAYRKAA